MTAEPMRRSLAVRLIGAGALWLAAILGIAGFGLSNLFTRHVEATYQRQLSDRLNQLASALEWNDQGVLILTQPPADPRYQQPYSGKYWQADAGDGHNLLHSRSLWDQQLALPAPIAPQSGLRRLDLRGPMEQMLMAAERSLILPGNDAPVRLAVTMDRSEIDQARAGFNRLLIGSLIALGSGLLVMLGGQIAFGLWPLRRLRTALAALRPGAERRLAGSWPREVAPLVDELNALLARDAATLERTRRQAADLAHGLKTPLAVLSNVAQETSNWPQADEVQRQTEQMRRQIERHLARARAVGASGSGLRIAAGKPIRELARAMTRLHRDRNLDISVEGDGFFEGDRQDLIEMSGNLMENACQWAAARVRVRLGDQADALRIDIEDDGPGLAEEQYERVLTGFERLDEQAPGSGLGMAISGEIARMYHGELQLARSELGGLRVRLNLPHPASRPPARPG